MFRKTYLFEALSDLISKASLLPLGIETKGCPEGKRSKAKHVSSKRTIRKRRKARMKNQIKRNRARKSRMRINLRIRQAA